MTTNIMPSDHRTFVQKYPLSIFFISSVILGWLVISIPQPGHSASAGTSCKLHAYAHGNPDAPLGR